MLERQDLEMIRIIMREEIGASEERILSEVDARITASEERILSEVDARITATEERVLSEVDARITASENLLLGELERVQTNLQSQLDAMKRKLDDLNEYYKIKKLDHINGALLLQMIQELDKRVEELEKRTA